MVRTVRHPLIGMSENLRMRAVQATPRDRATTGKPLTLRAFELVAIWAVMLSVKSSITVWIDSQQNQESK